MVLVVVVAGCGSVSVDLDATAPAEGLVADGAELFAASCALCHGADLRGTGTGPSFLSIVYEPNHHSDAAFFLAVQRGAPSHHWDFGDMPPVAGLEEDDVAAIVAFVRDAQQREGFEPYPP